MIPKFRLFMLMSLFILSLAACVTASPTGTVTLLPTSLPPTAKILPTTPPPTVIPTAEPTAAPTMSVTNPIPHFTAGQQFTVYKIHMLDANTGWATGGLVDEADHVVRTSDGGVTWKDVTPANDQGVSGQRTAATAFFQDAQNAWVVYSINGGNPVPANVVVWRTQDGGASWKISQPLDISGLSEIFAPSDLQLVSGGAGWLLVHVGVGMSHDYIVLYRTSDGGLTWSRIIDPYNDTSLIMSCRKTAMQFTDASHGWLTGDCGGVAPGVWLYKTSDGGSTWQAVTLPDPADSSGSFANQNIACGSYDPFFFSNDLGHIGIRCTDYTISPNRLTYFVYTTQDDGGTWTSSTYPGLALYFVTADTGWSLDYKIQLTKDGGRTWTPISDVNWYATMDFTSEQLGWGVATKDHQTALVKTENGGERWSILVPTIGQ